MVLAILPRNILRECLYGFKQPSKVWVLELNVYLGALVDRLHHLSYTTPERGRKIFSTTRLDDQYVVEGKAEKYSCQATRNLSSLLLRSAENSAAS